MLAFLLCRSQIVSYLSERFWGKWSFPRVAVLNLGFLWTFEGVLGEFLELPKGCQTTCHVCC